MATDDKKPTLELSAARDLRLRQTFGTKVDVFSDDVKAQLSQLDDDEIRVLAIIKEKLNKGLEERLRDAVDSVGVIVW